MQAIKILMSAYACEPGKGSEPGVGWRWAIETAASSQLAKRGIGKNFPPIGMEIIVTGFRARDGSTTANGATLKNSEGKDLFSVASGDADAPRR